MTDSSTWLAPPSPVVLDPSRLEALADLGLTERSDARMERFAERVRDQLGVPVSLVSLVQADQQVFPGMCGLPDPWASSRSTPLSHSFCQHVVTTGEPLVIEDARLVPLVRDNLATIEIGVVGYLGTPLTDDHGHVLGSLCAIDTSPRQWTERELAILHDIATDCSNELRLLLARLDADRERERRDAIDDQLQDLLHRSQQLLTVAEVLNSCRSLDDVRRALDRFSDPRAGLVEMRLRLADDSPRLSESAHLVMVEDVDAPGSPLDPTEREALRRRGARSVAWLPLFGSGPLLGYVELLWDVPHRVDSRERPMAAALAAYTGQALERAILIQNRIDVARELQTAMLAPLPHGTGLDLDACYLPAMSEEQIGGDWYDAFVLPRGEGASVVVSVGDITGHDLAAATVMGQVRAMLRQAAWDAPDAAPSAHLAGLELACEAFDIAASGTAVLARLAPVPGTRRWQMTWVNAGHPPPLVVEPDGGSGLLTDHDMMFGHPELALRPRTDHTIELRPGATVVLYTDGITDDSSSDRDEQVSALVDLVGRTRAGGAGAVVRALADRFVDMPDDVVALVLQVPAEG
ncbi:SpoIIE family protein phosphatase [Aeromicrobium sp. CFBP 8757]|uniref:GAF domain-containing SpoIIE family protein phosphatase n=1 Tax=Aeromicrobium sp. CFBP 8757 TaxID=2775288 RepID=UPI001783538B|nr:SpoIIE family protein phosphatase [Aeromicrobium sp. CFBP 8757]